MTHRLRQFKALKCILSKMESSNKLSRLERQTLAKDGLDILTEWESMREMKITFPRQASD